MVGDTVELKCITKFIEMGYYCSIPYGNSAKYDFIADIDGKLLRMQCKKSSYVQRNGVINEKSIIIHTCHQTTNTKCTKRSKYTDFEIDYFCTWFDNKVYVIPVNECGLSKTLNLERHRHINQSFADNYSIEHIFGKSEILNQSQGEYLLKIATQTKDNKVNFCKNCGGKICDGSELCLECSHKAHRKVKRPDKDTLKKEIRTESFCYLGRKYGVSDKSISKWCKEYSLPNKKYEINKISDLDWEKI